MDIVKTPKVSVAIIQLTNKNAISEHGDTKNLLISRCNSHFEAFPTIFYLVIVKCLNNRAINNLIRILLWKVDVGSYPFFLK